MTQNGQPRSPDGRFGEKANSYPEEPLTQPAAFDVEDDVIVSRKLVLDVLRALAAQRESLTLVGGHAVIERTQALEGIARAESTKDGDLTILPVHLREQPNLEEVMSRLGFVRSNRYSELT